MLKSTSLVTVIGGADLLSNAQSICAKNFKVIPMAANMGQALCLECARENGDFVVARKGVADLNFTGEGCAAHAGIEPERGASAAITAAGLVLDLQTLAGSRTDVSLNVINAGTQPNVVAATRASRVPGTTTGMAVS